MRIKRITAFLIVISMLLLPGCRLLFPEEAVSLPTAEEYTLPPDEIYLYTYAPERATEEITEPTTEASETTSGPEITAPYEGDEIVAYEMTDDEITRLAKECINGKWGHGAERRRLLTEAGYDYDVVQDRVNEIWYSIYEKLTD